MKTYKELEREAYITGNTELAKAYADLVDIKHELVAYEERRYADE